MSSKSLPRCSRERSPALKMKHWNINTNSGKVMKVYKVLQVEVACGVSSVIVVLWTERLNWPVSTAVMCHCLSQLWCLCDRTVVFVWQDSGVCVTGQWCLCDRTVVFVWQDSRLKDILQLLQDGLNKKTIADRINYGLQLKTSLEDFAKVFLPHMEEEEEVGYPNSLLLHHLLPHTEEEGSSSGSLFLQQFLSHTVGGMCCL